MNFRPLNDSIVVAVDPIPEKRGLLFRVEDKSIFTGTVLAVGPGKYAKKGHRRIDTGVVVGDRVAFHRWHAELKNGRAISSILEDCYKGHERVALVRPEDMQGVLEGEAVLDT